MNAFTELTPMLKTLRLSGMLDSLDARNRQAITEHLATHRVPDAADSRRAGTP